MFLYNEHSYRRLVDEIITDDMPEVVRKALIHKCEQFAKAEHKPISITVLEAYSQMSNKKKWQEELERAAEFSLLFEIAVLSIDDLLDNKNEKEEIYRELISLVHGSLHAFSSLIKHMHKPSVAAGFVVDMLKGRSFVRDIIEDMIANMNELTLTPLTDNEIKNTMDKYLKEDKEQNIINNIILSVDRGKFHSQLYSDIIGDMLRLPVSKKKLIKEAIGNFRAVEMLVKDLEDQKKDKKNESHTAISFLSNALNKGLIEREKHDKIIESAFKKILKRATNSYEKIKPKKVRDYLERRTENLNDEYNTLMTISKSLG